MTTAATLHTGPLTAATLALLHETGNEWLQGEPPDAMHNPALATLAWLYIHTAPRREVETSAQLSAAVFFIDVLEFGDGVSVAQLMAAEDEIRALLSTLSHTAQ